MGLSIYDVTQRTIKLNDAFTVSYKLNENDSESTELLSCVGFTIPQPKYKEELYKYGNKSRKFLVPDYDAPEDLQLQLLESSDLKTADFIAALQARIFDFNPDHWYYIEQNIYEIRIDIWDNNFTKIVYSYIFRYLKLTNFESFNLDYASTDAPGQWNISLAYMFFTQGLAGDLANGYSQSDSERTNSEISSQSAELAAEAEEFHSMFADVPDGPIEPEIPSMSALYPPPKPPDPPPLSADPTAVVGPKSPDEIDELAWMMANGKLGNGADRIAAAKALGFSEEQIKQAQSIVNKKDWKGLKERHEARQNANAHQEGQPYEVPPPNLSGGNSLYQQVLNDNQFTTQLAVDEGNAAVVNDRLREEINREDLAGIMDMPLYDPEAAALLAELEDLDDDEPVAPAPAANDFEILGSTQVPKTDEDVKALSEEMKGWQALSETYDEYKVYGLNRGFTEEQVKQAEAMTKANGDDKSEATEKEKRQESKNSEFDDVIGSTQATKTQEEVEALADEMVGWKKLGETYDEYKVYGKNRGFTDEQLQQAEAIAQSKSENSSGEFRGEELTEKVHKGEISSKGGWVSAAKKAGYTEEEIAYAKDRFNNNKEYAANWDAHKKTAEAQEAIDLYNKIDNLQTDLINNGQLEDAKSLSDAKEKVKDYANEKIGKANEAYLKAESVRGTDPMTFNKSSNSDIVLDDVEIKADPNIKSAEEKAAKLKSDVNKEDLATIGSVTDLPDEIPDDPPKQETNKPTSKPATPPKPQTTQPTQAPTFGANTTTSKPILERSYADRNAAAGTKESYNDVRTIAPIIKETKIENGKNVVYEYGVDTSKMSSSEFTKFHNVVDDRAREMERNDLKDKGKTSSFGIYTLKAEKEWAEGKLERYYK